MQTMYMLDSSDLQMTLSTELVSKLNGMDIFSKGIGGMASRREMAELQESQLIIKNKISVNEC